MARKSFVVAALVLLSLTVGCASTNVPYEEPITLTIEDEAERVRGRFVDFVENDERLSALKFNLVSSSEFQLNFAADCSDVRDPFACSVLMMAVGNSGWDGPYDHIVIRTVHVDGITKLSAKGKYCAINMMGRENCNVYDGNQHTAGYNRVLRRFAANYYPDAEPPIPEAPQVAVTTQ